MNRDMPRVTPVPGDETDSPYVLHWVPGYIADDGTGTWDLQTLAAYNTGAGPALEHFDAPRNAGADVLGALAARKLGFAVILEQAGNATITSMSLRPLSLHRSHEPVWHVRRAS